MRNIASTFLGLLLALTAYCQLNTELLGRLEYKNTGLNDVWGHVDSLGNEYALVGLRNGVSIVDISNPVNPEEIFFFPGPKTNWRDIITWKDYAYVCNERDSGIFIIDLSKLPSRTDVPKVKWYSGPSGLLKTAHNIWVDENGIAYVIGHNLNGKGALFLDLSDPWNPDSIGSIGEYYIHDLVVRGDTMWASAINGGFFSVVDVADKSNPKTLITQQTPGNKAHNCWPSDDGKLLFTTDEIPQGYIAAYDVSDLDNVTELDRIQSSLSTNVVPHNVHVLNNYLITSYYTDGVQIVDATRPHNLIEVGNYDTSPLSGFSFNACWGVYPYLPSGNIIASDVSEGLFVIKANYKRACYLEGKITDVKTGLPLSGVTVRVMNGNSDLSKINGAYSTGAANFGTYQVQFRKPGYESKTVYVTLEHGKVEKLNVQLTELPSFAFRLTVTDVNGAELNGAKVKILNEDFDFDLTADAKGQIEISKFYQGRYKIAIGKWGYLPRCLNNYLIDTITGELKIKLQEEYYDDFSLDFGWTVSSTTSKGIWEQGEPVGTYYDDGRTPNVHDSLPENPGADAGGCLGGAYVTGNTSIRSVDDVVTSGYTDLISPVFNLDNYDDPFLSFQAWIFNWGYPRPRDYIEVLIMSNTDTAVIDRITRLNTDSSVWNYKQYRISDFITPSDSMRLRFRAQWIADSTLQWHFLEGGVDMVQISDSLVKPDIPENPKKLFTLFPNPFEESVAIKYDFREYGNLVTSMQVFTMLGNMIYEQTINKPNGQIFIETSHFNSGIYFVRFQIGSVYTPAVKIVKVQSN